MDRIGQDQTDNAPLLPRSNSMGNIFLRFLLSYSNACTISIMDMIVVTSELLVAKIKRTMREKA
jgi:hypothetical protein